MISHLLLAVALAFTPTLSGNIDVPCELSSKELRVFGHVLRSPEIKNREGESFVSFSESPGKRWVVIGYDEPFEKTLVWLYDRATQAAPKAVRSPRLGKHFGVEWHGDDVFAVFWSGMGYKTSQLFRTANPDAGVQLSDLIVYDPVRDVYARYAAGAADRHFVIIGRAFHRGAAEEKFPIKLYVEDVLSIVGSLDIRFGGNSVSISYESKKGLVTETFPSKVAEQARQ